MRSFPEQFPIRYAILIEDHLSNPNSEYLDKAVSKVLWHKLIKLLQKSPMSLDLLHFEYRSVNFSFQNIELCRIPELRVSDSWTKEMSEKLKQILPEGLFGYTHGLAYDLGLYSYEGMGEVPLFWQVLQHEEDKEYLGEKIGLYHSNYADFGLLVKWLKKAYSEIEQGNTALWELQKTKDVYSSDLTIPYSELWAALDKRQNNGLIPLKAETADIELSTVTKKQLTRRPSKIKVRVFRSMSTLFTEEMLSLYSVAAFCNNCHKILPFDYKGKYCPDTEDNEKCKQERDRKRQKLHSQKPS